MGKSSIYKPCSLPKSVNFNNSDANIVVTQSFTCTAGDPWVVYLNDVCLLYSYLFTMPVTLIVHMTIQKLVMVQVLLPLDNRIALS